MTDTINMPREVVEQALDALKNGGHMTYLGLCKAKAAGDALEAALSAAAEPVKVEQSLFPNGIAHLIPPITMSVGQLRYAVLGMGGDDNETLLTFQHRLACKDMDGEDAPAGMVCWLHEYREEGSLHLPSDIAPPWPAVPDAAKPEQQTWEEACEASRQNFLAVAARIDDPSWEETDPEIRVLAEKAVQQSEAAKPETQGERAELIAFLHHAAINARGVHWQEHEYQKAADMLEADAALLSAGPARVEPLTHEMLRQLYVEHGCEGEDAEGFARAIERAHGIGKDKAS